MRLPRLPLLLLLAAAARGCYIQGQDSGECRALEDVSAELPFCSAAITYPRVCVPRAYGGTGTTFTTKQPFSWGAFVNHTVAAKDAWVAKYVGDTVARRLAIEADNGKGLTLLDWEGVAGKILIHFTKNANCENAFRNYMCFLNFPRCDDSYVSLQLCRSVCTNFFKACDYPPAMFRCGSVEFFGGDAPETSLLLNATNGGPLYFRAPWPGAPFTDNKGALPVCTPGLASAARAPAVAAAVLAALAAAVVFAAR